MGPRALLLAQDTSASITGEVRDAAGAAVPGADVKAVHVATGVTRSTVTGEDGSYVFTSLPIGTYQLAASLPGFKKAVRDGVELHIFDRLSVDFTLEVGEIAEEISVVAHVPQVQTETSEKSGLISGEEVRDLQLNGRSFMTLLELLPGVASDMPDRADPNTNPSVSINGARSSASNFDIDGSNNMDIIVGSSALNTFTSVDTIAEFKVITSIAPAEYGKGGFAQVNVVTRGGAKQFRGSFYEFFRNDALDARDYFSHQVLPLKLNNFGYTIGGPLVLPGYNRNRDKTFFFFTQEFNHLSTQAQAVNTRVPTEAHRKGDFSDLGPGKDGKFGTADDPVIDPVTKKGFPGGIIPASRMDPNAVKIIQLFALPNAQGRLPGVNNFTSAAPSVQRWREELIRIDHNFSTTFKMYGRYAQDSAFVRNPYGGSGITGANTRFPGLGATQSDRPGKNFVVRATHVISPTLVNEAGFTWSRRLFDMQSVSDLRDRTALGIDIPELFPENKGNIIPQINLGSSYSAINISRGGHKELFTMELSDNLTKIAGRHILKTGIYYFYGGNLEQKFSPQTNGAFNYTTGFSKNPVANLLLGFPNTYTEVENTVWTDARFGSLEAFIQDDFKVRSNLTLNLGLRYSAYFNPYDRDNVLNNFIPSRYDPALAPRIDRATGRPVPGTGDPFNGIVMAGTDSPYGRRVTENHTDLVAPRIGFAFDPWGKKRTVLRGGYGIFYTRPLIGTFLNNGLDNPPFSRSITIQQPSFTNPAGGREAPAGVPNLTTLVTPMLAPTNQQWSFGVQQQLFAHTVLDVSYVGSHGTHLLRPLNINSPPAGLAAAEKIHINAVRPFLGYGNITQRESSASSSYHSLQAKLNRRLSGKLTFSAAYTFSKSIDNASSDRGGSDLPPDSRNAAAERGPSDFDRRHIFTGSYIWHLPRPAKGGILGGVLNGWQLSGIARFWSGKPFDLVLTRDVAGIGTVQNQRPDVIADTRGPRTVQEWFNRAAFARPKDGAFGNMGRNTLRGPGVNKWDIALFKNFQWSEDVKIQFRAEAFNAFNHPNFTNVGRSLFTSATAVDPNRNNFSIVTGTRDERVLRFALKVNF